jgi:hypothetical protein
MKIGYSSGECLPGPATFVILIVSVIITGCSQELGRISVHPTAGSGSEQTFRLTMLRVPRDEPPLLIGMLINHSMDGANGCYVFQNTSTGDVLLVNDSGEGSEPLDKAASIGNTQCEVLRNQTSVSVTDSEVNILYHIRFRKTFTGMKRIYAIAQDAENKASELKEIGEWDVP